MSDNISDGYAHPDIAGKQRVIVDRQLEEMYAGNAPAHFAIVGKIMQDLRALHPGAITLLDAGCSSAYYSEIIEYYVPGWTQYTGLDYNPGMVEMANTYYPELSVMLADIQRLEFFNRDFDMVLSSGTLVHVKDWHSALSGLMAATKQWLLLHRTWVYFDGSAGQCASSSHAYGYEVWDHHLDEQEIIDLVESGGFHLIRNYNSGEGPPDDSNPRIWGVRTHLFERT